MVSLVAAQGVVMHVYWMVATALAADMGTSLAVGAQLAAHLGVVEPADLGALSQGTFAFALALALALASFSSPSRASAGEGQRL